MHQNQSLPTEAAPKEGHFERNQPVLHRFLSNCPLMSVHGVERGPGRPGQRKIIGIRCYWFDGEGKYQSEIFHSNSLRAAEDHEIPAGYVKQPQTALV